MDLDEADGSAKGRWVCETVHRAAKRWIQFDVRGLRTKTKHLRMKCKFTIAQLLCVIFEGYIETEIEKGAKV